MFVNRILQGDCTRVVQLLPSSIVDLVITDPPYGVSYRDRDGRTVANDDCVERILGVFDHVYRIMRPDTLCVSFYGWQAIDAFFEAWRTAGFRPVGHLVWTKNYTSRSRYLHYRHEQAYLLAKGRPPLPQRPLDDVQPWVYSHNHWHPTEKAVQILRPLIATFSARGGLVFDPFAGSGSTLIAAASLDRRYLGVELDPQLCETIQTRLLHSDEWRLAHA